MSNWIIHFLISNIFICIFTLVIIGTKKTSEKIFICGYTVPSLFSFYFYYLPVPFFPVPDSWLTTFFMVTFFSNLTQDLTLVPTRYPNLPVIHKYFVKPGE